MTFITSKNWYSPSQNLNKFDLRAENDEDIFISQIYKRCIDNNGKIQEKIIQICEMLDIDSNDIVEKKLLEFKENGNVAEDLAQVRYDYYQGKRKAKLIAINETLKKLYGVITSKQEPTGGASNSPSKKINLLNEPSSFSAAAFSKQSTSSRPQHRRDRSLIFSPQQQISSPSSSFPTLNGDLLKEMQKEKEKLHRFMQAKQRSKVLLEDYKRKINEQVSLKEFKTKKKYDKMRKESKNQRLKVEQLNFTREQKINQQKLLQEYSYMESDEYYTKHFEEIKLKDDAQRKKEREWQEIEYKRYNEHFIKSVGNYETYLLQKRETDKITSNHLNSLEFKINEGYVRSIQQKEQVKRLAAYSLTKIGAVIENQKQRRRSIENDTLLNFIETKTKYDKQIQRFERTKEKKVREKSEKTLDKWHQVKVNQSYVQDSREKIQQSITEKQDKADKHLQDLKEKRSREIMLRQEKEQLKIQDQKKNIDRIKKSLLKQKLKIFEKHSKIDESLFKVRENKAHLVEYNRIANEIRLQNVVQTEK